MNKSDLRNSLSSDISSFLASGGTVTICKSAKVRRQRSASGTQKLSFGWKAPINRPSSSWDLIP